MAVHCAVQIRPLEDETFGAIDSVVMGCAFQSQNELGRLFDEHIYERDIANRLRLAGLKVHTQVPLIASWNGIEKTYFLDLVVDEMVYELKSVRSLSPVHDAQVITYAALLDIDRIKLINFRTPRVIGKLIGTPFRDANRPPVVTDLTRFKASTERCAKFAELVRSLTSELGGFLDSRVYSEFLVSACGGSEACESRVAAIRDTVPLGTHAVARYDDNCAFYVTAHPNPLTHHEDHLRRMIRLLPIRTWQWINIHHANLTITTLLT